MANVYTSDFNSATVGSIAPSWANKIGTFAVASAGGVIGSRYDVSVSAHTSGGRVVQRTFQVRVVE